ncbi:MAG: hypothetical protein AB1554_10490 [Chloroflexota bacterium]
MHNNATSIRRGLLFAAILLVTLGCNFLLGTPVPTPLPPRPTPVPATPTDAPPPCTFQPSVEAINWVETGSSASCPIGTDPIYQSFLASSSQITSVSLLFRAGGSFPSSGYTAHLVLRDCQIDGPILAEADATIGGQPVGRQFEVEFILPIPLEVPVGRRIFLQWSGPTEGAKYLSWMFADGDPYPDGAAFGCIEKEIVGEDFIFQVTPR